jgi:ubiquinone/menaquinone biosynthesis C-methylase UbiE
MAANYDNSAWFYDSLSKLIYGKALINAQVYLLQYIPANSSVLIVGGGTGWILEEITRIHSSGLQITYVEVSAKMVALSQKRDVGNNKILFVTDAVENVTGLGHFDVIITPFLFDNFIPQTQQKVFNHLNSLLKPGGIWLNTDFQLTGRWWQVALLKSMLLFFRMVCRIESDKINDVEPYFIKNGYKVFADKTFFGEFVISKAYKKTI